MEKENRFSQTEINIQDSTKRANRMESGSTYGQTKPITKVSSRREHGTGTVDGLKRMVYMKVLILIMIG